MRNPGSVTFWATVCLLLCATFVDSFLVGRSASVRTQHTSLFYTNHNQTTLSSSATSSPSKLTIPILGPLLNVPTPLIVGASLTLEHLTPLQWKTIETCVEAMQQQNDNSNNNMATIDQAPLVAILPTGRSDLATLAAVVGLSSGKDNIDTTSSESLQESLLSLSSTASHGLYNDASKVRLMGIGRAKLTKQFVQTGSNSESDDEEESEDDNALEDEPVLMAQMELLLDSHDRSDTKKNKDDDYGHASSPVHALNKLSMLASRIRFLHQDRQRIVRGLQAAQLKLDLAMEEWEDHDGIGAIFEQRENEEELQSTLNSFLREFDGDAMEQYDSQCMSDQATGDSMIATTSLPLSSRASRCLEMDNFGLGSSSTAFSDLTAMAEVLAERLSPYYSPQRIETEEFTYEAFSWVALESVLQYLSSFEIVKTLESQNTCERLERLYRSMGDHKRDLTELVQAKSQELRDCGEECTGFF